VFFVIRIATRQVEVAGIKHDPHGVWMEQIARTMTTSSGYISNDGGSEVTARGVCWNTTGTPTLADSCTSDGTGVGYYASTVTGLGGCDVIY